MKYCFSVGLKEEESHALIFLFEPYMYICLNFFFFTCIVYIICLFNQKTFNKALSLLGIFISTYQCQHSQFTQTFLYIYIFLQMCTHKSHYLIPFLK